MWAKARLYRAMVSGPPAALSRPRARAGPGAGGPWRSGRPGAAPAAHRRPPESAGAGAAGARAGWPRQSAGAGPVQSRHGAPWLAPPDHIAAPVAAVVPVWR